MSESGRFTDVLYLFNNVVKKIGNMMEEEERAKGERKEKGDE